MCVASARSQSAGQPTAQLEKDVIMGGVSNIKLNEEYEESICSEFQSFIARSLNVT